MKRSEWQSQVRKLENRDKEIKEEYDKSVEKLETTYKQEQKRWSTERDEGRSEVIDAVAGGSDVAIYNATNRVEYAENMLKALEEGRTKKLDELEHGYELDKSANDLELQELQSDPPLAEVAIENMDILLEFAKLGYETVSGTELPPIDVGGEIGWQIIKGNVKNAFDMAEQIVDNIVDNFKGDPQTPREERLEHWIDQAQGKFDEKYKDAPAQERDSMQDKLDQNFDLLRAALERQQEREQEHNIEPEEEPPFDP